MATLAVSLSSAMVAGGITAWAALTIAQRQGRATLAREVRAGIGNYFGALTVAVAHLQRMPENAPYFDPFEELVKHAPKAVQDWFAAQRWLSTEAKMRRVLGRSRLRSPNASSWHMRRSMSCRCQFPCVACSTIQLLEAIATRRRMTGSARCGGRLEILILSPVLLAPYPCSADVHESNQKESIQRQVVA